MLPLSRAFSRRPKMLLQRGCASTTTPFNTACAKFRKQLPGFPIKKNQVHILNTPTSFYESIATTEDHIVLSSLYLGTEPMCVKLQEALFSALSEKPNLKVTFLIDALRGSRQAKGQTPGSSTELLFPLLQFEERVQVYLYHTPKLSGVAKKVLPARVNEVIGVQHIKAYIFDKRLIISGANLQDQYFTDRQDRYLEVNQEEGNAPLVDYYSQLIDIIAGLSYKLSKDGQIELPSGIPPPDSDPRSWEELAHKKFFKFLEDQKEKVVCLDQEDYNTWIYPTLQVGPVGILQDSTLTSRLLADEDDVSLPNLTLTSPYFNLTKEYQEALFKRHKKHAGSKTSIIVAAPSASGFYKSKGLSYYIPPLYSKALETFIKFVSTKLTSSHQNITFFEYSREGWTFHAKGLWMERKEHDFMMTLIGSANLSNRSVFRDVESQLLIVTQDPLLMRQLQQEKEAMQKFVYSIDSKSEHWTSEDRKLPPFLLVLYNLFLKKFM